jgi:hypothetical protein
MASGAFLSTTYHVHADWGRVRRRFLDRDWDRLSDVQRGDLNKRVLARRRQVSVCPAGHMRARDCGLVRGGRLPDLGWRHLTMVIQGLSAAVSEPREASCLGPCPAGVHATIHPHQPVTVLSGSADGVESTSKREAREGGAGEDGQKAMSKDGGRVWRREARWWRAVIGGGW